MGAWFEMSGTIKVWSHAEVDQIIAAFCDNDDSDRYGYDTDGNTTRTKVNAVETIELNGSCEAGYSAPAEAEALLRGLIPHLVEPTILWTFHDNEPGEFYLGPPELERATISAARLAKIEAQYLDELTDIDKAKLRDRLDADLKVAHAATSTR